MKLLLKTAWLLLAVVLLVKEAILTTPTHNLTLHPLVGKLWHILALKP